MRRFLRQTVSALGAPASLRLTPEGRWASVPALVLLAFLVQYLVLPKPAIAPFVFFYFSVALASWLGGRLAGLVTVGLSALVANYMFVEPYYQIASHDAGLRATLLFLLGAAPVALLCASFRESLLRAEEAAETLRQQADLLRLSHDAIFVWSLGGPIQSWNHGAEDLYGWSAEEACAEAPASLLHTVFPEPFADIEQALRAKGRWDGTLVHHTKDGRALTVEARLQLARGRDGVDRVLETARDVTERAEAEARIRHLDADRAGRAADLDAERRRWRAVVEGIADEVWVIDAHGSVSFVNFPAATPMGFPRFEGRPIAEVADELAIMLPDRERRPPDEAPLLRSLRGETISGEEILPDPRTGIERHRQFSSAPVRDAAGAIVGAVAIVRDVTETKRMEAALRDADRRKDEFLAVLSHELRNPLTPIRYSLHVLDRVAPESEQARRARATIDHQVTHMTRLVEDLLDIGRISRGKVQLQRRPIDLAAVVGRTIDDHRAVFSARGVALEWRLPPRPIRVYGDDVRMAQVVGNLLHNAAKFTSEHGRVDVDVHEDGTHAVVRVRDTGIGIAPEMLSRIFEPFTQEQQALDRSAGGLGLGLALVRGLIELHGGAVEAHSDGAGHGAELSVRVPLDATHPPDAPPPPEEVVKVHARRVLIIEDNVDVAESLQAALTLDAHEVSVAFDGPSGIERARESAPEIVLCDIGLPGMDGYEVARAFRADVTLRGAALVALTGYALAEDRDKALAAGFDSHLAKPPDLAALERLLSELPTRRAA